MLNVEEEDRVVENYFKIDGKVWLIASIYGAEWPKRKLIGKFGTIQTAHFGRVNSGGWPQMRARHPQHVYWRARQHRVLFLSLSQRPHVFFLDLLRLFSQFFLAICQCTSIQ